jgi:hypothetical protein
VIEQRIIWDGHAKTNTEGPHVYKKDGFYYLLVAEGGTFKDHMVSIARSRSIWGPFESYEQNPILSADGTDRYIQHTGHADLFQDADHEWWAVVLGVRNFEDQGRFPMGRESFLTHVKWPENGWPQIAAIEMDMERKDSKVLALENTLPKFEQPDCVDFVYIRDPDLENYTFSEDSKDISERHLFFRWEAVACLRQYVYGRAIHQYRNYYQHQSRPGSLQRRFQVCSDIPRQQNIPHLLPSHQQSRKRLDFRGGKKSIWALRA